MNKIIILTGSATPNSVSHKVAPMVAEVLSEYDNVATEIVDVAKLDLPFFDAPIPPSQESFTTENENVKSWTKMVAEADGVILLTPEYNGNVTAIQKNAVDWIYKEWNDMPIAMVGYGWYDVSRSQTAWKLSFEQVLKSKVAEPFAQLKFMADINPDGSVASQSAIDDKLRTTIAAFMKLVHTA